MSRVLRNLAYMNRKTRLVSASALAVALAGCASLPTAQPARVAKPAENYQATRSLQAPVTAWPSDAWWTDYQDPQLTALIEEAIQGSPTLASAAARVRAAQAAASQARARTLPSVDLNASAAQAKQSYNLGIPPEFVPQGYNDLGRLTLDFAWELDFWGRNRAAVAAAVSETRAAEAELAQARLILSTGVAVAYADLARLYDERDVAERAMTLRRETSALVAQRVANGLDTRGDQRQAEAEPLAAQADLAAIDEQIALTRNRLAALLGEGPDRGLAIARPKPAALKPFGLPANLALDLLGRRPDVVAARWRAEAAGARVKAARAAFLPNVNLAAFVGAEALYLERLFDQGSDIGSAGPAVSLPIFRGGALRAGLRGAQAGRDEAVAQYEEALTQALREVADVVAAERALQAQLRDSQAALAASEDAYRIARLRYQGGLSTYPAVLLSERSVLVRRRVVADLQSRAFALDVALVRALGGGFQTS